MHLKLQICISLTIVAPRFTNATFRFAIKPKNIARNTELNEKFQFSLQYDANQEEFLLDMLETIGAIVEDNSKEMHSCSTMMNMKQLTFIKRLECVKQVKTNEGVNPFLNEEAVEVTQVYNIQQENDYLDGDDTVSPKAVSTVEDLSIATARANTSVPEEVIENDTIAVASVTASESSYCSSCCCPTNVSMKTALSISDESYTSGRICCPGAEQWFKFVAKRTGRYTICTTGNLDTVGTLYDCCGNKIVKVDDYAPCGKINFRIVINLTVGSTYYVKVGISKDAVGSYTLRVTERVYANYVSINKNTLELEKGVTYELPVTPNYVYKGVNGAKRIPGFSVSINPIYANEQRVFWYEQIGDVLKCSYGRHDDGSNYIHVTAMREGTIKLYAEDWDENGKRDECTVTVVSRYEKYLKDSGGFSSEEVDLILKLYDRVESKFSSESRLSKAWRCARLLSEFSYDYLTTVAGISINRWDDVAGSVTTNESRKSYFTNTLGYTESEYDILRAGLLHNHDEANKNHTLIDFTHMQYALAARLAYTLDKDGIMSNLGSGLYTGNYGIYTDEEISYLGGWLGDAVLTNLYGQGTTAMKNEDYMADLDAENIYRLIIQGQSALDAANGYYSSMTSSNTRAEVFL